MLKTQPFLCLAIVSAALLAPAGASAAITTQDLSSGPTAADLVDQIAGPGTTVSAATYVGNPVAAGTFSGGTDVGIPAGVILGTGLIGSIIGPNIVGDTSTDNGFDGADDLEALVGLSTSDAAILEFDVVPDGNQVTFDYVFGSEEYNEYVGTGHADVFAFRVNGRNCAQVPGSQQPVSVDTINANSHSDLFNNNDIEQGPSTFDTGMDGFTTVLSCNAAVNSGVKNHVRLAIADAGDAISDSNILFEADSLVAGTVADKTKPVLSKVKFGKSGKSYSLGITVSEASSIKATFKPKPQKQGGKKLMKVTVNKKLKSGANTVKLKKGKLKPGRYKLSITATDAAGNKSQTFKKTIQGK